MAMIPLNQAVTVKRAGVLDEWGQASVASTTTYKCRIDGRTEVVRNLRTHTGQEAVSKAQILLDGAVPVSYDDVVEWTDEVGNFHSDRPLNVSVLNDFSGKPLFTKVVI